MAWLTTIYVFIAVISGVSGVFNLGFWPGLAGTLAPLLALIGGGGITSPNAAGYPKLATILVGVVMVAVAIFWLRSQDWQLNLFGLRISGTVEAIVGFALGFGFGLTDRGERGVFTNRQSQIDS